MNHIDLIGRLVADPETRTVSDVSMTTFTLAVQRKYTPKGEEKQADFIKCVAWRRTADFIAKYLYKGRMMGASGSLQTRQYTTRDGDRRTATEVVIDNAYFCDDKRRTEDVEEWEPADDEDGLPF